MKIYAIQNIETKLFLEPGKAMARSRAKFGNSPRLFTKKSAASNALNCWLAGVWHNHVDFEGQPEGPMPPEKAPEDRANVASILKIVEAEVNFNA